MSAIRTNAAASMLGVSPNTLRSWERRFGYPMPQRTEGGHRQFELAEIEALRQAFEETHNISSAISIARERGEGISTPARLSSALAGFDQEKADRLLEESLTVRSVERTVTSLLLPAVETLEDGQQGASAEYGFAWRYATGWLAAAVRIAPAATRDQGVIVFDASHPTDVDSLYIQALELFVRRSGLRVLTLPAEPARVEHALLALKPGAIILSGSRASLDTLGRLVWAARQSSGALEVLDYRGALPDTGASTVQRLGSDPQTAATLLRELLSGASHASATHAGASASSREASRAPRFAPPAAAGASA
ncbi:MAG TPA: MerR family transcriptional regulator [Solirubrobacteraceae bacterium]|nr:MerR family transcriptional regulator [Solirubrobacteraceae bacterium]